VLLLASLEVLLDTLADSYPFEPLGLATIFIRGMVLMGVLALVFSSEPPKRRPEA
jgi:hypothetical protein